MSKTFTTVANLFIAAVIVSTWMITLTVSLNYPLYFNASSSSIYPSSFMTFPFGTDILTYCKAIVLIALMTHLFTGLFITAHDAMHGVIVPNYRLVNKFIGQLCLALYASFSFRKLIKEHKKHHAKPGTFEDPDFHRPQRENFFLWYIDFVLHYVSFTQILCMVAIFNVLKYGFNIEELNLILFWVLPSILSTFQLFYFGTYLPHRDHNPPCEHNARNLKFNYFFSLISCYHFGGMHLVHHESPHLPWWKLYT